MLLNMHTTNMKALLALQSDKGGDCDNTLTITHQTPITDDAQRDLVRDWT